MKEDSNKKEKFNKKRIMIYVVFILILLYMIYAVYLLVKEPTDKVTVEKGTLYLEETNIGYVIRNEQVVKGNNYKNGMEQIQLQMDLNLVHPQQHILEMMVHGQLQPIQIQK